AALARRAPSLSAAIHPELSLVAFTLLAHVAGEADVRAADLAEHYALDTSTVSRQPHRLEGPRPARWRRRTQRPAPPIPRSTTPSTGRLSPASSTCWRHAACSDAVRSGRVAE